MGRPSVDAWALNVVKVTSQRSTCLRRQVGCVLLNEHKHIIATGYNGVAAGAPHCNDGIYDTLIRSTYYPHQCPGARAPSGTMLDGCHAIHAEQNALLQCHDVHTIHTCYVSASPCMTCVKLLMNTSCKRIVFLEEYTHPEARDLWVSDGMRSWELWVGEDV